MGKPIQDRESVAWETRGVPTGLGVNYLSVFWMLGWVVGSLYYLSKGKAWKWRESGERG